MKSAFLHPLLFAVFPILFLFSHNAKSLSVNNIFLPLVIVIPFTLLMFFIAALVFRNQQKAGIFVSLFMLLFFSFGHFTDILGGISIGILGILFGANKITALIWILSLLSGIFILLRRNKDLNRLTGFLNLFAAVLIAIQLVSGAYALAARTHNPKLSSEKILKKPDLLPDIYYIILDGYSRSDILKDIYKYDNNEFINYLKQTGFYIADESHSNYCQTLLSMTSSLNMNYVGELGVPVDLYSKDRMMLAERLWNNNVINPLADQLGFSSVSFASGYSLLELGHFDAFIVKGISLNEYHHVLLRLTPVYLLSTKLQPQYRAHRNQIIFTLERIPEITEVSSPKFVYAHILAPHPPFVFDENGELTAPDRRFSIVDGSHFFDNGATINEYLKGYLNNLVSINNMIENTINKLKANAEQPFIIILQGDHGPGSGLDWESLENTNVRERFSILNAYYFYDQNYSSLYPQITPVNTFRVIFNQYFGTDYDLLADRSYYSTWDQPFKLTEVTDNLKTDKTILQNPALEK